jgi:hypothetical protein
VPREHVRRLDDVVIHADEDQVVALHGSPLPADGFIYLLETIFSDSEKRCYPRGPATLAG